MNRTIRNFLIVATALILASCTIAPTIPKPRLQPILSGNAPLLIVPTHDAKGNFTGYSVTQGYVDLLNSLYDGWGYLLTPPRRAGFGITPDPSGGYKVSAEAERNRIELEAFRDQGKPKQTLLNKIGL